MLSVECGTDWTADNSATDIFTATITSSTSLTVSAEQNYVEEDRIGTITLYTATQRVKFATITVTQSAYGAPEITVETNEWRAPAAGELSTDIAVEATADWTAEVADAWLTVEKTGDGITLTAAGNEESEERETKVTLACTDGHRTTYEYIDVTQDAAAYVTLDVEKVLLAGAGDSAIVTVESNYDWDYTYDSDNGWYTVARSGDELTITSTVDNQTDEDLASVVIVTAGDGAENIAEAQISVVEENTTNALILVYTITSAGTTVTLPLSGTINCSVYWGDGSSETVTSAAPTHTYADAGEYAVVINGTVTALSSKSFTSSSKTPALTAVKQWGNTGLTDMSYAFYFCKNLESVPEDTLGAFADVETFYYAFYYCTSLKTVPSGLFTYANKATTVAYLFDYCTGLATIPEDLFDGFTSVEVFDHAFGYCYDLAEIPAGLFSKCTAALSFQYTFRYCTSLTSIPARLFVNCTEADSFYSTFTRCSEITTIGEGLFDTCTKVTSFYTCFAYMYALTTIPEGIFAKNTEVDNFYAVFRACTSLESLPENLFANCSKATTFGYAFYGDTALKNVPESTFSGCTGVTTFTYCFSGCSALETVPEKLFSTNTNVDIFKAVFYNCPALTEIPAGLFAANTVATDFMGAFAGCTAVTKIPENLFSACKAATDFNSTFMSCTALTGESAYDVITVDGESVNVHLYERSDYTDSGYTAPTSYGGCYDLCTGLDDYYTGIPTRWGGGYTGSGSADSTNMIGTYTASGFVNGQEFSNENATWTLKIYAYTGTESYDYYIDGLVPWSQGDVAYYGDYRTSAYASVNSGGQLVIPSQASSTTVSTGSATYYLGYTPCTQYSNGTFYYSSSFPDLVFEEDSSGSWESYYGVLLCGCTSTSISSLLVYFQEVAPTITLVKTADATSLAYTGVTHSIMEGLKIDAYAVAAK